MSGGAKRGRPRAQLSSGGFYQPSSGPGTTRSVPKRRKGERAVIRVRPRETGTEELADLRVEAFITNLTVEELLRLNDQAVGLLLDRDGEPSRKSKRSKETMDEAVYATDPEVVAAVFSPPLEPEQDTAERLQARKAGNLKRMNDRARKRKADRTALANKAG